MDTDLENDLKNDPQARPTAARPQPLHPESSEADFLTLQQEHAKAAIGRVVSELKGALADGANPKEWMQQYPWATLGVSAVAGFVATTLLVPSREQQALKKLAEIERALNPGRAERERDDHPDSIDGKAGADDYKAGKQSFMTSLLGEAIKAVRPALISLLTAGVTAKAAKPSPEEIQAQAAGAAQDHGAGGNTDAGASA